MCIETKKWSAKILKIGLIILIFLSCFHVNSISIRKEEDTYTRETKEENQEPTLLEAAPPGLQDMKEAYTELLTNYDRLLHDSSYVWKSGETFDENNVYYRAAQYRSTEKEVVYAVVDLAVDGHPELLIGSYWDVRDVWVPFIIYGYTDGKLSKGIFVFDYTMMLYEGGIIEVISGRGLYDYFSFSRLKKNSMDRENMAVLSADRLNFDSDEYIYYISKTDEKVEITREEYEAIYKELTAKPLQIDWKPLEGFWRGE